MMEWIIAALAGAVTGVLSGFGVGGGSLLLIYMTSFAGLAQNAAQGINLLYFLPTAAASLPFQKRLCGKAGAPACGLRGAGVLRPHRVGGYRIGRGHPAQVLRRVSHRHRAEGAA